MRRAGSVGVSSVPARTRLLYIDRKSAMKLMTKVMSLVALNVMYLMTLICPWTYECNQVNCTIACDAAV